MLHEPLSDQHVLRIVAPHRAAERTKIARFSAATAAIFAASSQIGAWDSPPGGILHQRTTKGAGGKGPRQKTSKIVKKFQKYFRHFSTFFAQGKKRQKSSKSVKIFFDTFRQFSRGTSFPAPFGALTTGGVTSNSPRKLPLESLDLLSPN